MSYINTFHADDSFIDHSWSLNFRVGKGLWKVVVHTVVANDGLMVSCGVKAINTWKIVSF